MPSHSKSQARMMRAAAHSRGFAKRVGVPQSVARDYVRADAKRGKAKVRKLPEHKR